MSSLHLRPGYIIVHALFCDILDFRSSQTLRIGLSEMIQGESSAIARDVKCLALYGCTLFTLQLKRATIKRRTLYLLEYFKHESTLSKHLYIRVSYRIHIAVFYVGYSW